MPALCRDCLAWFDESPGPRCPECRGPRMLSHPDLGRLSIAHMDCDAFYASVEKRDDPTLSDKALIVGGGRRGVVSTCCYVARVAGVRSAMPMFKALKLCPEAVVVRPRMDVYSSVSREIRAKMEDLTPQIEPLSLDEAFLDLTGTERLFGQAPARSMAGLALSIERDIGVTVSIGLSHNKYLAKIASDLDKPRGFSVLGPEEAADFLAPRSVRTIWGVGRALADRLEAKGLMTNADLRRQDPDDLLRQYGTIGRRLFDLAHGHDSRQVDSSGVAKSISSETTFSDDIADPEILIGHLWRLAVKVSDRSKAKYLAGETVTLKMKTADFKTMTRQTRLSVADNLADTIHEAAEPMLRRIVDKGPFRLIGVGLSSLVRDPAETTPGDLFDTHRAKQAKAEAATDEIRARFGNDSIIRGRALR
ncbi:MAG: DNA polymerase IV [Pseudomonadota bacterium]